MAMRSVRVDGAPGGRGETPQLKSWLDPLEISRGVGSKSLFQVGGRH